MSVFTVIHVLFRKGIAERVYILVNIYELSISPISELPILRILFMWTCLSSRNKEHWKKKWFADSISFPHIQISSGQSLKLRINL